MIIVTGKSDWGGIHSKVKSSRKGGRQNYSCDNVQRELLTLETTEVHTLQI